MCTARQSHPFNAETIVMINTSTGASSKTNIPCGVAAAYMYILLMLAN
jgi:hypothetical protein